MRTIWAGAGLRDLSNKPEMTDNEHGDDDADRNDLFDQETPFKPLVGSHFFIVNFARGSAVSQSDEKVVGAHGIATFPVFSVLSQVISAPRASLM